MVELLIGAEQAIEIDVSAEWSHVLPVVVLSVYLEDLHIELLYVLHFQIQNDLFVGHEESRVVVTQLQDHFSLDPLIDMGGALRGIFERESCFQSTLIIHSIYEFILQVISKLLQVIFTLLSLHLSGEFLIEEVNELDFNEILVSALELA